MRRFALLILVLLLAPGLNAQSTPLIKGRAVSGSLAKGDTARYSISADSNSIVRATVDQTALDVAVRVMGPSGTRVAQFNGPTRSMEYIQFEATRKGSYQLLVYPVKAEAGAFTVTLVEQELLSKDPRKFVDQLLAPLSRPDGPGVVVAVWQGGKTLFSKAYGMANLTYDVPFAVTTPTNIGSSSKQFTSFAVMLLVEQGKVSLDDDVRKHIPELPDFGKTVTVRNLLTHTSGYREFLNALALAGRRLDHGDFIDRKELIEIVQRQPALQNDPGAEFNYNNTAFGLAAVIVERVSGMSFPEFMKANVFQPIGMTHTMVRPSPEHVVPGMSEGYTPNAAGEYLALGDLGGATGAGTIYTTVGDLQKWGENMLHPRVGSAGIVKQMMTPYTLTNGKSTGYGLGLFIDTQGPQKRVHHGGADVAHRSQLVYYPDIDAGITVQSNFAGFDSGIAFRFAEAFFAAAIKPPTTSAPAVAFDPKTFVSTKFDDFVGRYALDAAPAFVLTFTRNGDTLYAQATGQERLPIFPTSDSTFELRVVKAAVSFHRDPGGKVVGATLHQGADQHATRLAGEAEKPWKPAAQELAQFAGRFFSAELETFYTIAVKDSSLTLAQRRIDTTEMAPGAKDTFSGDGTTISFERDRNGKVIALYASNVRTRGVRFAIVP